MSFYVAYYILQYTYIFFGSSSLHFSFPLASTEWLLMLRVSLHYLTFQVGHHISIDHPDHRELIPLYQVAMDIQKKLDELVHPKRFIWYHYP